MYRNVASKIALFAFDITTGAAKTGDAANLTAYVSKDSGTVTVLSDTSATEMDATKAPGWYLFDLAQGETDAVDLLFTGKSTTGSISVVGRPVTTTPDNFSVQVIDSGGHATVLISQGVGTGQLQASSGVVQSDVRQWLGLAVPSTNVNGVPLVDLKYTLGTISPATAGSVRADAVTGAVGSVTGAVGSVTADVGITQAGADKAWSTAARTLTAGTNIVLAKGVGVTGFNDLSAAQVNAEADTALADVGLTLTVTGRIDAAISSRLASASYTAPDNTSLAAILAVTNKLNYTLELGVGSPTYYRFTVGALELAPTGGSAPSAATIADAVWDEALAGHAGVGSTGAALSAAGSAGDPWATALPGAYGAGTAGKIIGDNIDATISSRTKPADTQAAVTLVATTTNLTNAPTNGDLTAAMIASVTNAATAATPTVTAGTVSDKTGYALSTAGNAAVADKLLGRNLAGGSDGTRTVQDALRSLRNKTSIAGGTLTVCEEDDATPAWTAVVTTTAGDPLSSIDPA